MQRLCTCRARRAEQPAWANGLLAFAWQLMLMAAAALLYFGVRGLTESDHAIAVANAHWVHDIERVIKLDVEHSIQDLAAGNRHFLTVFNWIYIWGHWPVIVATFVWLHHTRPNTYGLLRNAMFVSGAIGLVIFATFPVAPPRLADLGLVDTVTDMSHSYRVLQPPALVNKYAALPSLHVGWNLLVGVFVFHYARQAWLRWLGAVSPLLMFAAVVVTANHFVIDGIIGAAIALTGLVVAMAFRRVGGIRPLPVTRSTSSARDGRPHVANHAHGRPHPALPQRG